MATRSNDTGSPSQKQFRYRQRDHRQRQRFLARFRQCLQQHGRDAIIDLDESGFEPDYPTRYAWSLWGQVVDGERSSHQRPRQNLLAARNPQECLAPMIVSGSITALVFECWLEEHLCPVLPPHSVLILDNARFHRPEQGTEMVAATGHQVLVLPPYSTDFNKIEHDFAALKKILAYAPEGTTLDEVVVNYRCA